jgi:hypothetical protein
MKDDSHYKRSRSAGPWLRCFLTPALALVLAMAWGGAAKAYGAAAACPVIPEMTMSKVQGTVYGPSGIPLSQIVVQLIRDGSPMGQMQTDGKGRFTFKSVGPGNATLHVQFLGTKSLDLKLRVVHHLGLFHTARLRIVLALSGTKCSFATTKTKDFKEQMRRYSKQLEEVYTGP